MRSQAIVEHREAALLAAAGCHVERPSRDVVVLCQHPELVDSYVCRPPLRFFDERAANPSLLEGLLDADLIEQYLGAAAVETLQPVGSEEPAGFAIPARDQKQGIGVGEESLTLLGIPGHAFVEHRVELRGDDCIDRRLPAHGQRYLTTHVHVRHTSCAMSILGPPERLLSDSTIPL